MIRLSANSLRPFFNCERQYFYSYLKDNSSFRARGREWIWPLEFGNAVHEVMGVYDLERLGKAASLDDSILKSVECAAKLSSEWDDWRETTIYNSWNLARIPVWYSERFGEDNCIQLPIGWKGEDFIEILWEYEYRGVILNGRIDMFVSIFGENYLVDRKTTAGQIDGHFIEKFSPDLQFSLYLWICDKLWPNMEIKGLLCEGIQLLVGSVDFERFTVRRSKDELEEFEDSLNYAIERRLKLEGSPEKFFLKNEAACFLCGFKKICAASKEERERRWQIG